MKTFTQAIERLGNIAFRMEMRGVIDHMEQLDGQIKMVEWIYQNVPDDVRQMVEQESVKQRNEWFETYER